MKLSTGVTPLEETGRRVRLTDMSLIQRCVSVIHDFCSSIYTTSWETIAKIIAWITLVVSVCISIWYVFRLSQLQETEFTAPIEVSASMEILILELMGYTTITIASFLLLLGVYFDIPGVMLPSFLVQLLVEVFLARLHRKLFLASGVDE